jgi:hypothetical protein
MAIALVATTDARAQTPDYPPTSSQSTEPSTSIPTNQTATPQSSQYGMPLDAKPAAASGSGLYAQQQAQLQPNAPAYALVEHFGIDETLTDNVYAAAEDRRWDLSSYLSAGLDATADTSRLNGALAVTAFYKNNLHDNSQDQFLGYAYGNAQVVVFPGNLFLNIRGNMDDVSRTGGTVQNPLAQTEQDTHTYSISASPVLMNNIGDLGTNILSYQVGKVWFDNNTAPIAFPGLNLGPINSAFDQSAQETFRMPGTIFARLLTDLSLRASEDDSGRLGSGQYTNLNGEIINEYEITRSIGLIGGVGYEKLHDDIYKNVDGSDVVWDAGLRFKPNADSDFILTYGRHDLESDFSGEMHWQFTPLTSIYASYTDSISDSQQAIIGNVAASQLGIGGAQSGVTNDQSTVIGTLDTGDLGAAPGSQTSFGIPLSTLNNALPLQNGLFRVKSLQGSLQTTLNDVYPTSLTIYHEDSTQLTGSGSAINQIGQRETSDGVTFSVSRQYSEDFGVAGSANYSRTNFGDTYGASVSAIKVLSQSLSLSARYDFIGRDGHNGVPGYTQNLLTLGIHATLD